MIVFPDACHPAADVVVAVIVVGVDTTMMVVSIVAGRRDGVCLETRLLPMYN